MHSDMITIQCINHTNCVVLLKLEDQFLPHINVIVNAIESHVIHVANNPLIRGDSDLSRFEHHPFGLSLLLTLDFVTEWDPPLVSKQLYSY